MQTEHYILANTRIPTTIIYLVLIYLFSKKSIYYIILFVYLYVCMFVRSLINK